MLGVFLVTLLVASALHSPLGGDETSRPAPSSAVTHSTGRATRRIT